MAGHLTTLMMRVHACVAARHGTARHQALHMRPCTSDVASRTYEHAQGVHRGVRRYIVDECASQPCVNGATCVDTAFS